MNMNQLKALKEKLNAKIEEANAITNKAVEEVRAMTDAETGDHDKIENEIRALKVTIEKAEAERTPLDIPAENRAEGETEEDSQIRAFAGYIRNHAPGVQNRAEGDVNLTPGDNGAIIPKTIADRIIKRLYDISPVLQAAQHYTVKGQLDLPYYDEQTSAITVAYAEEFGELTAKVGQFKKITLTGYLAASLALVSRSLMNGTDVDLVSFVVNDTAEKVNRWIERELLIGTDGKIEGLSTCKQIVTAKAASALELDDMIDVQDAVPDQLQNGAMWIMHRSTRTLLRKLKDGDGKPLMQPDITAPFGYTLLGKPVFTSDNMPKVAAGASPVYYGNFAGLAVKFAEQPTVEVLREKYAEQHAVGAIMWMELDAKIQQEQAISKLQMAAS
ncbi:phage major capsid protein [Raoultibacter timonensis]|uniref:Phage capsid-like C-terminal domain-containing protein n=1 Tax=Raoultibacter timonensis TaxID=1907662 RepID=A0ABN6MAB6_9ACTN|nr:phage major capsid protein [Raoultibacter timonensis]BDE94945.1 hypothetical protein CE91St30_02780 [Raoultibacter timonensis]BDF49548.1 hypothetical protein CE91St31_02780 [Raoultibacter timonensis]